MYYFVYLVSTNNIGLDSHVKPTLAATDLKTLNMF